MKNRIIVIFLIVIMLTGCNKQDEVLQEGEVRLILSQNFGQEIIMDVDRKYEDMSALDLLIENVDIETTYGGSFVHTIQNIQSGFNQKNSKEKTDWFYYINGYLSPIGSADYFLKPGDIVQWDFHDWSKRYASSMIGAFPRDLVDGYGDSENNLQIMLGSGFSEWEEELTQYFNEHGAKSVEIIDTIQPIVNDKNNTLVIGLWKDLQDNEFINKMVMGGERTGVFFNMDNNIKLMDKTENFFFEAEEGSIITSFIKDMGNMTKLYVIAGHHAEDIEKALEILFRDTQEIEGSFSVYISPEKDIIKFPR
ncbi:MAG: DUF4430 domain-containing protein [Peptostreptococcales bacterium]